MLDASCVYIKMEKIERYLLPRPARCLSAMAEDEAADVKYALANASRRGIRNPL